VSVWAILVAAGRGERLGLDHPKAFAKLGEDPLLAEPLRRLEDSDWIDGIVVVAPPDWEEPAILLAEELGCGKVNACVAGGATRTDSVRAGFAEVPATALVVLVHDVARPLISDAVIERVLAPLSEGWDGAVPGIPVADTLKRVGRNLGEPGAHRVGARLAARDARTDLAAAELFGQQDRGLFPPGRRDEHDRVHPARFLETAQRLGEERILAELCKRLRLIEPEPLPAAGRHENCPD